jgi:hypothetical protein
MEPTQVPLKTIYVIYAKVQKLEEKFDMLFNQSTGKTENGASLGWYVQFEGSTESIYLSHDKPVWAVGDTVKISFGRMLPYASAKD